MWEVCRVEGEACMPPLITERFKTRPTGWCGGGESTWRCRRGGGGEIIEKFAFHLPSASRNWFRSLSLAHAFTQSCFSQPSPHGGFRVSASSATKRKKLFCLQRCRFSSSPTSSDADAKGVKRYGKKMFIARRESDGGNFELKCDDWYNREGEKSW